jgi:hypothetical protein
MFGSFISRPIFANSAAAARIPSGFEFIRNEESRNAGEKPVHGFMGSLSKREFIQRLLTSSPTSITNGFAGVWFRHEKPLRFRAGPAGATQAFMDCGDMSPLSKRRRVGALQRRTRASS